MFDIAYNESANLCVTYLWVTGYRTSHTMLVQLPKRLMKLGSGVVCRVNLGVIFCRCRSGQAPSCRLK